MRGHFAPALVLGMFATSCAALLGVPDLTFDDRALPGGAEAGDDDAAVLPETSTPGTDASDVTDASDASVAPDAAPPIGCPLGCLPPAIPGWFGPSAVYDGTTAGKPTACPTLYTLKEDEGMGGAITAGPPMCSCGAGAVTNPSCAVTVSTHLASGCSDTPIDVTHNVPGQPECVSRSGIGNFMRVKSVLNPGTCVYPNGTKIGAPPPTFERSTVVCGLPQLGTCSGRPDCVGTPVPDAPFTRLCIYKEGEDLCPSLDYAARFVMNKSFTDGRGCGACSGAPAGGACGAGPFSFSLQPACPTADLSGGLDTCLGARSVSIANAGPTGVTCPSGTPQTTGAVTFAEPVTLCCNR